MMFELYDHHKIMAMKKYDVTRKNFSMLLLLGLLLQKFKDTIKSTLFTKWYISLQGYLNDKTT